MVSIPGYVFTFHQTGLYVCHALDPRISKSRRLHQFLNSFKFVIPPAPSLLQMAEEKGVKFHLNTDPEKFNGDNGQLTEVVLKSGETLPADVCIMGVGVTPSTGFLKESGITLNKRQAVIVDKVRFVMSIFAQ